MLTKWLNPRHPDGVGEYYGVRCFSVPANLASTGGIAIYGWLVTITVRWGSRWYTPKCRSSTQVLWFLRLRPPLLWAVSRLSNQRLYWLACWIGNIAMVVIGVGF